MLNKLLVRQFDLNIKNQPLMDEKGNPVKEKVRVVKKVIHSYPLQHNGINVMGSDDKVIMNEVEIPFSKMVEQKIIPTRILAGEFFIYQKIGIGTDERGQKSHQVLGTFNEDGSEFSFLTNGDISYESKIVEEDIKAPTWYKE